MRAEAATLFMLFEDFGLRRILDALEATELEVFSFLAIVGPQACCVSFQVTAFPL